MSEGELPQWPRPGTLTAWLSWPSTPPRIGVEQLDESCNLLCDVAGECSLVVLSARGALPTEEFAGFVERVRASFRANRQLFIHAAWAAQLAKNSVDPARCGDVTMETMHAAVIQFACNIAEWQGGPQSPPVAESLEALRRYLARDSFNLPASQTRFDPGAPIIDLPAVTLQLRAESALARRYLPRLTPDEERAQFCFNEWQGGKTLKEINVALKNHPTWKHFENEKAVRGPINAWAARIGVEPRKGQPGRRATSARNNAANSH